MSLPDHRVRGVTLHSSRDPVRQAERFVSYHLSADTRVVIVVGAGFGYLIDALKRVRPQPKVVGLQLIREIGLESLAQADHAHVYEDPQSLTAFLYRVLSDPGSEGVQVLTWEPAIRAAGHAGLEALRTCGEALKRLHAERQTSRHFQLRWLRNMLRNMHSLPDEIHVPQISGAVLLAASGPSLVESMPLLRRASEAGRLIAVSSALSALLAQDIMPNIVVSTDPGFWARSHLAPLRTIAPDKRPLIAYAITGQIPGSLQSGKVLPFAQGLECEKLADVSQLLYIPESATVTLSAAALARTLGADKVVCAGLDLAFHDILSHATPHASGRVLEHNSFRLSSMHSRTYRFTVPDSREIPAFPGWRRTTALETYAGWITEHLADLTYLVGVAPLTAPCPLIGAETHVRDECVRKPGIQLRRVAIRSPHARVADIGSAVGGLSDVRESVLHEAWTRERELGLCYASDVSSYALELEARYHLASGDQL